MSTKFGNFLRNHRINTLHLSLREVAGEAFSPQSLSNYERGLSLPSEKSLKKVAECYRVDSREISDIYSVALSQTLSGPIPTQPFLETLKSARRGDHLLTITQKSIFVETAEYAKNELIDLLYRGTNFTYVAYVPSSKSSGREIDWEDNHAAGARVIERELRRTESLEKKERGHINYLLIGNPDAKDFLYLRGYGSCNYLCRAQTDEIYESEMWVEVKAPDGRPSWSACDYGLFSATHDWLLNRCGLQLPSIRYDQKSVPNRKQRDVRMLSLDDFLKTQT